MYPELYISISDLTWLSGQLHPITPALANPLVNSLDVHFDLSKTLLRWLATYCDHNESISLMITARVKISYHQNIPSVAHRALTLVKGTSSKILKKTVIFHCKCIDINSYHTYGCCSFTFASDKHGGKIQK